MNELKTLAIRIDVRAAAPLWEVAVELQTVATALNIVACTVFNGTPMTARPGGSSSLVLENWHAAREALRG